MNNAARLVCAALASLMLAATGTAAPLDGISFSVPCVWPCPELSREGLKALWLEGEPYGGKPTRVFAYLALPAGASAEKKAPGMVLAHGGAGTAYASWALTWAKRGYAAIVVDNCGAIPLRAPGAKGWARSGTMSPLLNQ